jgi:hypothetical protein
MELSGPELAVGAFRRLRARGQLAWKIVSECHASDLLPAGVDRLGRDVLVILPGLLHLERRPVVEPRVGAVVVAVDVGADPASGVVEGLVLVQPHLPFFEFPEPALDEGLALGVAVAAAAVADPELGQARLEAAGGEGGAVVAPEDELARLDPVDGRGFLDHRDRFVGAAAQLELPGDDLAGAAVDDST